MAQRPRGGGGGFRRFFGQAQITRGAMYLLFVTTGLSLVFMMGGADVKVRLATWVMASGASVWGDLKLWTLVTGPLLEPSFVSLLFQAFTLWMFLPALERWWGMKRFLTFAAVVSVVGTLVGTLVGVLLGVPWTMVPVAGLDPFVFGGIVAYGVLFANQPVQFFGVLPMTGRQLTWGIIAFAALFILLGQSWVEGSALAAGMITAWFLTSQRASPRLWLLKWKQRRQRSHLRVVGGGKGKKDEKRWMN